MPRTPQRRRLPRFLLCAAIFLLPAALLKLRAAPQQNTAPLQITTRLVEVSVVVSDHHGRPVPDLKEEDFKIFDDGVAQGISDFEVEQRGPAVPASSLPPNMFTNVPERTTSVTPEVTVILLDGLNTQWTDQAQSAQQIIKFLRQLKPGDRLGLYALGRQLVMLHDFTSDSAALVQALTHYNGRANSEVSSSQADNPNNPPVWTDVVGQLSNGASNAPSEAVTSAIQNWLSRTVNLESQYYMNQRVQITKAAFVAIANHLRGVPGRKNLIWVSSAFPLLKGIDQVEQSGDFSFVTAYDSAIAESAQALSDANLAVYPVDARGLMPNPNDVIQTGPTTAGMYARAKKPQLPSRLPENFGAMDQIAQRTGGRAFYNSNDIQGSIRQVIDDSRLSYLLGYYPEGTDWNGKFHKIKVVVDQPGLRLEYRDGYFAIPAAAAAAPVQTAKQALDEAALSPLDATGIGLVVRTGPGTPASGGAQNISLQYWIDPHGVTLAPVNQPPSGEKKWSVHITLVTIQFGPQGQSVDGSSHDFTLQVNATQRKNLLTSGFVFGAPLAIVPGAERLRVIVRDDPTGSLGSVNIPLDRVLPRPADNTITSSPPSH